MIGRDESGLQKCKKMKTYRVIKIYFADEKGFGLLNSYFKSEKANVRIKREVRKDLF